MKIVTIALVVLLSGAVFAGEDGTNQDHAGEEAHPPHTLAVFAGVTIEHGEHLNTLGLEYSYRINQNWSLGGVIERADREKILPWQLPLLTTGPIRACSSVQVSDARILAMPGKIPFEQLLVTNSS